MDEANQLTEREQDVLIETFNVGVGRAADLMSRMLDLKVDLTLPQLDVIEGRNVSTLKERIGDGEQAIISMDYQGNLNGSSIVVFPYESSKGLVDILTHAELLEEEFESFKTTTLTEFGNIILNGVMGTVGNIMGKGIDYSPPNFFQFSFYEYLERKYRNLDDSYFIVVRTSFVIEDLQARGHLVVVMGVDSLHSLLNSLLLYYGYGDE